MKMVNGERIVVAHAVYVDSSHTVRFPVMHPFLFLVPLPTCQPAPFPHADNQKTHGPARRDLMRNVVLVTLLTHANATLCSIDIICARDAPCCPRDSPWHIHVTVLSRDRVAKTKCTSIFFFCIDFSNK